MNLVTRHITKSKIIGTSLVAILVPWTSPAFAHDVRYPGNDGYGQVRDNHEIVDACDTRENGQGFSVQYMLRSGAYGKVGDGNGSKPGCGIQRVGSPWNPVVKFTICTPFGCSPWRPVPQ